MTELTQEQITEQTNEFFNYLASRFSLESIQLFTEEQMAIAMQKFYQAKLKMLKNIEESTTTKSNAKFNLGLV